MSVVVSQMCLSVCLYSLFFLKQKTAYEMLRSLVGSDKCIRDSYLTDKENAGAALVDAFKEVKGLDLVEIGVYRFLFIHGDAVV